MSLLDQTLGAHKMLQQSQSNNFSGVSATCCCQELSPGAQQRQLLKPAKKLCTFTTPVLPWWPTESHPNTYVGGLPNDGENRGENELQRKKEHIDPAAPTYTKKAEICAYIFMHICKYTQKGLLYS